MSLVVFPPSRRISQAVRLEEPGGSNMVAKDGRQGRRRRMRRSGKTGKKKKRVRREGGWEGGREGRREGGGLR